MIRALFLLFVTTFAKQNFRATNTSALEQCFIHGLCDLDKGCCSGHGTCQYTTGGTVACGSCDAPQECYMSSPSAYTSASNCATLSYACCTSGSSDLIFGLKGTCRLTSSGDPERGAKGNLLKRIGNANYSDSAHISTISGDWNSSITQMVNALTGSGRPAPVFTSGNMMGLGFLEFAIKDIVDFVYETNMSDPTKTVTFYGVTYPKLKWQNNTGITAGTQAIPKQFENCATAVIDLGPLFDWAVRSGNYLDLTAAITHWRDVHHMPVEFLVALQVYGAYHHYAVRNLEEYFCGANSLSGPLPNPCTISPTGQSVGDWIYEQARRSTIRFSQSLLQQGVLQITLEHPGGQSSSDPSLNHGMLGYWDPVFDQWFRRDLPVVTGYGFTTMDSSSIPTEPSGWIPRTHQEWAGDVTRTSLRHYMISGLDFLLSMRNPNVNTTAASFLSYNCEGLPSGWWSQLATDVVNLTNTRLQRYGSRINSQYQADLALQLYRSLELGLSSYKTHIAGLTNTPSVSDLTQDYNVYYGAQIESNSSRQYKNTIASVAMASIVPISDVTIVERTSYWHADENGIWTGPTFHPDPQFITLPASGYQYCYKNSNGDCTTTSINAGAVVLAYNEDMNILRNGMFEENAAVWRSQGCTFPGPQSPTNPSTSQDPIWPDFYARQAVIWPVVVELVNALFYQYDGLNSLAVKQSGSDVRYLANQIVDAIPTNIGFLDLNYDGLCYQSQFMSPSCLRVDSSIWDNGLCSWWYPSITEGE